MNELTANRRLMKSTYKNILNLMLPPSDVLELARCLSPIASVLRLPSAVVHVPLSYASRSDRGKARS